MEDTVPRAKKKPQAFAGHTRIALVWDESGSMAHLKEQGDRFIDEQIKTASEHERVTFSLLFFGTQYENGAYTVWDDEDPHKLDAKMAQYTPSGMTPMYDGIGQAVRNLERKMEKGDRALVVIFTDGLENASQDWNEDTIRKLIADKEKEGNWSFVYTAAGLDEMQAKRAAMSVGIAARSVLATPATPAGMATNSGTTSGSTQSYLNSNSASNRSFYDEAGAVSSPPPPIIVNPPEKKKRTPRVKS
jgi:hypothetical protein